MLERLGHAKDYVVIGEHDDQHKMAWTQMVEKGADHYLSRTIVLRGRKDGLFH